MELMKSLENLPHWPMNFDLSLPEELNANDEKQILSAFNAGQGHLGEQILYALEQIKISISHNDGNFLILIDELEENLNQMLDSFPSGQTRPQSENPS